jgi:hypothetical protein
VRKSDRIWWILLSVYVAVNKRSLSYQMPFFYTIPSQKCVLSQKEQLDEAHKKDLAVQGKYGVNITDYWHSEKDGAVFCLAEAPTKEAFGSVHREAHGLEADEIFEVKQGEK